MSGAGASTFASAESPSGSESIPAFKPPIPLVPRNGFAHQLSQAVWRAFANLQARSMLQPATGHSSPIARVQIVFAGVELRDQMQRGLVTFRILRRKCSKEGWANQAGEGRHPKTWQVLLTSSPASAAR